MHQGVEIKIIYEFLSAETRFFGYHHLTRQPLWGCFVREGPNHQSPTSIRPTTSSQTEKNPKKIIKRRSNKGGRFYYYDTLAKKQRVALPPPSPR
jgi:hypothetical protein